MNISAKSVCRSLLVGAFVAVSASTATAVSLGDIWQRVFAGTGETPPQEMSDNFRITLRDSVTGGRVTGQITFAAADGAVAAVGTDEAGRGGFRLAAGRNDIQISAPGYIAVTTYFDGGQSLDVTVWLDPTEISGEMRPETIASRVQPGMTFIHGHIIDNESDRPLAGARVYLGHANTEAISDKDGYFQMSVPTTPVDPRGDLPGTDDLVVEYGGSVIYRRTNTLLPDGAVHFIIDADKKQSVEKDGTHKLFLSSDELANTQNDPPTPVYDSPSTVTVPTSIRVGSTCPSKLTCSVFTVYTLDTYTRLGLDDEWISSWNANSLKAGAIAFRSYGSYHVFHPLTANYDICNTTSCQVMDPSDSATSTDNATAQTTGSVVTDASGNNVFFAEYAAENNLGGCPDGFTGNNTTWPCLSDTVDAGQTFNGHGRGMCQWGTQRWSINQGKDFVWIVNHYYNGNGNPSGLRTGILQLGPATLLPPPTLTPVGTTTAPGQAIAVTTPTFEWQPAAGADGYGLYISKFNGSAYDLIFNSETAIGQPLTGTSFTLPDGILQMGGQYRWNMSSHTSFGYGTANVFRNYFYISPPAMVSGRIFTSDGFTGLRNGTVNITDPQGARRSVTTSSFGYYTFANVATGPQYTINISSRRFRFQPQTVTVAGDVSNLDFVGLE